MSNSLACPMPSDINPLQSNGFKFLINKLPEVSYFCQEVEIPSLSLESESFGNPLNNIKVPGDKLFFEDLNISFMVDSKMTNYKTIFTWLQALGFPEDHEQYKKLLTEYPFVNVPELVKNYSDGTLQILGSNSQMIAEVTFTDLFPLSLSSVQLAVNQDGLQYIYGRARFAYTSYDFTS